MDQDRFGKKFAPAITLGEKRGMKNVAVGCMILALSACASTKKAVEPAPKPAETLYSLERANAIRSMHENFERVTFELDSATITPATRDALAANVELMRRFPDLHVEVEGHCDEQGSAEYNLALGQRRAEAIKKYMVLSGIASRRLGTISYGEEIPFAFDAGEGAYAQNRRAEFLITVNPDHTVLGTVVELEPVELVFDEEQVALAAE